MSFSGDVGKFARDAAEAHDKITRAATLDFFSGTIKSTPVDTGRARGGWTTGVGTEPAASPDRLDPGGSAATAEVMAKTPAGAGQETFMVNNLPYIESLENGNSKQAPAGMVRINLARVQRIVNAAIAKFKV
jgi:hypothetical protein